jgi:hypothetical protein
VDFYVVAFTDAPMKRRRLNGRSYQAIGFGPLFAIGERRSTPPSPTDEELRHQHEVVLRVAEDLSAVLPVRFGALTSRAALAEMPPRLVQRLVDGLNEVRDRAQMTVRFVGDPRPAVPPARAGSGRDYLESRRAAMIPALPDDAEAWLRTLRSIAFKERLEPGVGSLLATAYHLVDKKNITRYLEAASGAAAAGGRVTGPYPPFAFTPSIL